MINIINNFIRVIPSSVGGNYFRYFFYKIQFINLGKKVSIASNVHISGFEAIEIGSGTSIMSGSYITAHDKGRLIIGSNCSINHNVLLGAAGGQIIIGSDVLIGPNVVLRASNHIFTDSNALIRLQGHSREKITIGDNVWIGANTVITAGVNVGDGCVIGAGSVITKDLPSMSFCAGNPAKKIRSRI